MKRCLMHALLLAMGSVVAVADTSTRELVFVGCPILRDTNVPCWLGESHGELYYLGAQGDLTSEFYPPQLRHRMLVEGILSSAARICGGIVLEHVRVSVLPEVDTTCNETLPASGYPDPPHERGPGPSGVRGIPPPPPRVAPVPEHFTAPFSPRSFTVPFSVESERLWREAQVAIEEAARYATAAQASRIEIVGYRAQIRLSAGGHYTEGPALAESRAKAVAAGLRTVGVPARTQLHVSWRRGVVTGDSLDSNLNARRASLRVVP